MTEHNVRAKWGVLGDYIYILLPQGTVHTACDIAYQNTLRSIKPVYILSPAIKDPDAIEIFLSICWTTDSTANIYRTP